MGFPCGSAVKNLPSMLESRVRSLGWEDPLEKEMTTHSNVLTWEIPWTEELGGLQPMESQRVKHDWATNAYTHEMIIDTHSWGPQRKSRIASQPPHMEAQLPTCASKQLRTFNQTHSLIWPRSLPLLCLFALLSVFVLCSIFVLSLTLSSNIRLQVWFFF